MSSSSSVKKHYLLAAFVVIAVLAFDQILKYWVKTHMTIGESIPVLGNWFQLHFTENCGMAFGLRPGGDDGKILLTVFRMIAAGGIGYYLIHIIRKGASTLAVVCFSLILTGAVGNIVDSIFYGWMFTSSTTQTLAIVDTANGYAPWFKGCVVDMLYFPILKGHFPDWFMGGRQFEFFRPIFNIADSAISVGVVALIIFQRSIFVKEQPTPEPPKDDPESQNENLNEAEQVSEDDDDPADSK